MARFHSWSIVLTVATVLPASAGAAETGCASVQLLPGYAVCRNTPNGIAMATSAADADWGVTVAHQAEREFGRYFGAVPRYALTIKDAETRMSGRLRDAGYRQFIWASPKTAIERRTEAVRAALIAKYSSEGSKEPELSARVNRTIGYFPKEQMAEEASTVAHELGHAFLDSFWNGKPVAKANRYGTPGPDWLDETAAILAESPPSLQNRRDLFRRMMALGSVQPLQAHLDMVHPNFVDEAPAPQDPSPEKVSADEAGETTVTTSVKVEVSTDASAAPDPRAAYYSQTLAFAEFLVAQSGQPRIFESISRGSANGVSFERWLASEGPKYRLPTSVAALDALWQGWVKTYASASVPAR